MSEIDIFLLRARVKKTFTKIDADLSVVRQVIQLIVSTCFYWHIECELRPVSFEGKEIKSLETIVPDSCNLLKKSFEI